MTETVKRQITSVYEYVSSKYSSSTSYPTNSANGSYKVFPKIRKAAVIAEKIPTYRQVIFLYAKNTNGKKQTHDLCIKNDKNTKIKNGIGFFFFINSYPIKTTSDVAIVCLIPVTA